MHLWTIAAGFLIQSCNIGYAQEECTFYGETECCDACCTNSCCTESYDSSECDVSLGVGWIIFIIVACVLLFLALILRILYTFRRCNDMYSSPPATASYGHNTVERREENSAGGSAATRNIRDKNGPPPSYGSVMKDQRSQK